MFEDKTTLWVIHIGNDDDTAERAQKEGFICIGWTHLGNLAPYTTREALKHAYRKAYPDDSEGSVNASYGQVFRFAHEMAIGDPVVYPIKASRDLLIGEVTGPYRWADNDPQLVAKTYQNIRKVKWLRRVPRVSFSQGALHSFGSFSSVTTSDDFLPEVIQVLKSDSSVAMVPTPVKVSTEPQDPIPSDRNNASLADSAVEETKDFLIRKWTGTKQQFEVVVAAVLRAMGYTAQLQQGTHDLGVDVIAHRDPLGVQPPTLKIQIKSGLTSSGSKDVKALLGVLNESEKGIFISLGGFSNDALHVQQNNSRLICIDGNRFVELFLEFYDRLDPEIRNRFPLRRVHIVVG